MKMLARLHSHAVIGMEAYPVEVETDLGWGLPAFSIVGKPDDAEGGKPPSEVGLHLYRVGFHPDDRMAVQPGKHLHHSFSGEDASAAGLVSVGAPDYQKCGVMAKRKIFRTEFI